MNHLFEGALWIGAVKQGDTLVSVGADGWWYVHELYPASSPQGDMLERTTRPVLITDSLCPDISFHPDAVSEHDILATYTDTLLDPSFVVSDPLDGPHVPIGIRIDQTSYSWSFGYAEDFILMDLSIRNISGVDLEDVYIGILMDHDVFHVSRSSGYHDDISGFIETAPALVGHGLVDTIHLAWSADNDGDPTSQIFDDRSATSVTGVRVIRPPDPAAAPTFNWWVSNSNASQDWGPNRVNSPVEFVHGNLGTPSGDKAKYQMMANGELDYDQVTAAMDHQSEGWLPPSANPALAVDIANGFDTRYLISFGPSQIAANDTVGLTLAFVAGEGFHTDPRNFSLFFDPFDPRPFLSGLDFANFTEVAQWAQMVYDNPGVDTDGDGYRGEFIVADRDTIYYRGDGVPDYAGPPPPPAPQIVSAELSGDTITLRWNGQASETAVDPFSQMQDFEGFRLYLSTTNTSPASFALLSSRDRINYERYRLDAAGSDWIVEDPPFTLDSLQMLYNALVDTAYSWSPFHPDSFSICTVQRALREILLDPIDPSKLDTNFYCFRPFEANEKVNDSLVAYRVDSLSQDTTGVIRKVYPFANPSDTAWRNDGSPFAAHYEYEYVVTGIGAARYVHLGVSAFDFGFAPRRVSPAASPLLSGLISVAVNPRPGDVNDDGLVTPADLLTLVAYLFKRGPPPVPVVETADTNCDGRVSIVDVVTLVNYLYRLGPLPACP